MNARSTETERPDDDDPNWVGFENIKPRDVSFTVFLPVDPAPHWFAKRLTPEARVQPVIWIMHGVGEVII